MDITLMNSKIDQIRSLEAQIKAFENELDSLKDELKKELDTRKVDSVDTGLHKVFYNCYERASIDTEKLKKAGLYDMYSRKSIVLQFKITDVARA